MAASDLLFSLILIPAQITQLVTEPLQWHVRKIVGSIFCKLYIFAGSVSLLVSAQSLVWIAIDRFVAVVFPIKLGLISSRIRTIAIVSTWVLAGVFYFPLLITPFELYEFDNNTYCSQVDLKSIFPNKEGYNCWLHLTIRYFALLLLITVLYTAIAITLKRKRKAQSDTLPSAPEQRYLKKRRQATQMAIVISYCCFIFVLFRPHTLLHFVYLWKHSCAFLRSFYSLAIFLLLLSSVVNPIICLSFVESYRRGLKNIMCYFCAMQDNKRVKRERITLKRIRNLSGKNCERTSKDSNNFQETFDTLQKAQ